MSFDTELLSTADRELDALGRELPDVSELLAKHIDADRALSRIDEMLEGLSQGIELAPLPVLPEPKPKAPKAPRKKREPAKKKESIRPVESALREVEADEIPPIPPPSVPPPSFQGNADTVEREVPLEMRQSARPDLLTAEDDFESLTPAVQVPSVRPASAPPVQARAITLDDLDVDDVADVSDDESSSPELVIEAAHEGDEEVSAASPSDRASTQMLEQPISDLPPSASDVFQDKSDVSPISSVRPGPSPALFEQELFDDSAFTEVGEEPSDVFSIEAITGEKSLPAGPVLVDTDDAADLAALLEGELDPSEFDAGEGASAKSSDVSQDDDMEMLIDEEGSIEVEAPVDDEPTSPSVPPPAAIAAEPQGSASKPPAATPSKPPEGPGSKPPDGTGGGQGKGFFKKIFGR